MFPSDIQAVIDDFLPICRELADGRYAVSIGGSRARKTSDELSDIDFRLFCDSLVQEPDQGARFEEQLEASIQRWSRQGIIIDGCWIRKIEDIDAQLNQWRAGVIAPQELIWSVWGYHLLSDIYQQTVVDDPFGVIGRWKEQLRQYPPMLKQALLQKHLESIRYWRNDYHYRNKVQRKDSVFLAGLTSKLVHDLIQILFALNETYYVGDGYNLVVVGQFRHVPHDFAAKVEAVLYPGQATDVFEKQRSALLQLVDDVEELVERLGMSTAARDPNASAPS
ncbi:MAG: DUF4037 domain-containing protein [Chloroflexota bacterium]|nr:DUF4037 domain-containing protein [Chloroflexota bacterium]